MTVDNRFDVSDDRPMTPKEFSEWSGVSTRSLGRWRQSGEGPKFVKVGGHIFYLKSYYYEWMDERATHTNNP